MNQKSFLAPPGNESQRLRLDPVMRHVEKGRMNLIRNICVYCGSAPGADPLFLDAALELGRALAAHDIGLVYGGGDNGLMGAVARAVLAEGGRVTGIIPSFLRKRENMLEAAQELIIVDDMHSRKRIMFERADAFVALPGGIGTLEELVEQLTWVQLGQHGKPVLIADIAGFWKPLLSLFAHMRGNGFIREQFELNYLVSEKIGDVIPMLQKAAAMAERTGKTKELDARL